VTKFVISQDSAQDPAGGAYSAPPDPLVGLREPTSKGERKVMKKGKGRGRGGRRRVGGWKSSGGTLPPSKIP